MRELFCYEVTELDLLEMGRALTRCPGSETRRQLRKSWLWTSLLLTGIFAAVILWMWPDISRLGWQKFGVFWLVPPLALVFSWFQKPQSAEQALVHTSRLQKKAAGLDPAAPELHRVCLEGAEYLRYIGQRVITAIPLAALRAAKPAAGGGVVLLFNTHRADYLPARLFGPSYTQEDFCSWITAQAAEARKTPRTLDGLAPDAGAGSQAAYLLRFSLTGRQAVRLLSCGGKRLSCTPKNLKLVLLLTAILPALRLIPFLLAFGPVWGLLAALLLWGGFLLFVLGVFLLVTSPVANWLRLRKGRLDTLLGPQQLIFTQEQVTVRRAAGWDTAGYSLYTQLLETPEAWFLVSQGSTGLLPIPKEALPAEQHAAFAGFLRARLGGG